MNIINMLLLLLFIYYMFKINKTSNSNNNSNSNINHNKELKPWTDRHIQSHPNYYKQDKESNITNIGAMFDNKLDYIDKKYNKDINKYKQPIIKKSKKEKKVVINKNNQIENVYEDEKCINGGTFYGNINGYDYNNNNNFSYTKDNIDNVAY